MIFSGPNKSLNKEFFTFVAFQTTGACHHGNRLAVTVILWLYSLYVIVLYFMLTTQSTDSVSINLAVNLICNVIWSIWLSIDAAQNVTVLSIGFLLPSYQQSSDSFCTAHVLHVCFLCVRVHVCTCCSFICLIVLFSYRLCIEWLLLYNAAGSNGRQDNIGLDSGFGDPGDTASKIQSSRHLDSCHCWVLQ